MKPAIIYMLEVLVCSGVLLAAYAILLERRVKFRWCRLYLLLTTFAAALIPLLRIPVWPGRIVAAGFYVHHRNPATLALPTREFFNR